jgi:hypothetical protein
MTPKSVVVGSCGPEYARRYFLEDQDSNYWTEAGWTPDPKARTIWADMQKAVEKQNELMVAEVPGTMHTFIAPVTIMVKTESPLNLRTLGQWLTEALRVSLDAARYGTGPDGSMVMLEFNWDEMKEKLQ